MRRGSTFKTGRFAVEGEPLEGPKHNPSSLTTTSHHHSIAHLPQSHILRHPVWIIERSVSFPSFVFLALSRLETKTTSKQTNKRRRSNPKRSTPFLLSHAREVVITFLSSQLGSGYSVDSTPTTRPQHTTTGWTSP